MSIHPYGWAIGAVLADDQTNCSKVEAIFGRYTALCSNTEREAFVLALIAELLVSRARLNETARTDHAALDWRGL